MTADIDLLTGYSCRDSAAAKHEIVAVAPMGLSVAQHSASQSLLSESDHLQAFAVVLRHWVSTSSAVRCLVSTAETFLQTETVTMMPIETILFSIRRIIARISATACFLCLLVAITQTTHAQPISLEWLELVSTLSGRSGVGLAVDSSGRPLTIWQSYDENTRSASAVLRKYTEQGKPLWERYWGPRDSSSIEAEALALTIQGSAVVAGRIGQAGVDSVYFRKYDAVGDLEWSQLLRPREEIFDVQLALDGFGNTYLSGNNQDGIAVKKFDETGTALWTRVIGTDLKEDTRGIATNLTGDVYITGSTSGDLAGPIQGLSDLFLTKLDANGTHQWSRQWDTAYYDRATGVVVDHLGNVVIAGITEPERLPNTSAFSNTFVTKFAADGTQLWTHEWGTIDADDAIYAIALDDIGDVYVGGSTRGDVGGVNAGGEDALISKISSAGELLWSHQLGTSARDVITSIAIYESDLYVAGRTNGELGGNPNPLRSGFFLARFTNLVPEPNGLVLFAVASTVLTVRRSRRRTS